MSDNKKTIPKLVKNVSEIKTQATRMGQDAAKTVGNLKSAVQAGVNTSKQVLKKASAVVNKKALGQGMETTSKGIDLAAKGARIASKGAETIANSMEKASQQIKKVGVKLRD